MKVIYKINNVEKEEIFDDSSICELIPFFDSNGRSMKYLIGNEYGGLIAVFDRSIVVKIDRSFKNTVDIDMPSVQ